MRFLPVLLAVSCASAPRNPEVFSDRAQVVDGELAADEDYKGAVDGYALSDRYVAVWEKAGPVHMAVRGDGVLIYMGESWKERVGEVEAAKQVKFWVVSAARADIPYQLVIDPPPYSLAAPPRNDAAGRREQYLKKRANEVFVHPRGANQLERELSGYQLDGSAVPAKLEAFAGMELPLEADRCYRLFLRLGAGAKFSDVAQRGLTWKFEAGDLHTEDYAVFSSGILSREICPSQPVKAARLSVQTPLRFAENDLGTGPLSVEVWKKPDGPFAHTAAERDAAIARSTRGFALVKTVSTRLEAFKGVELPLKRGGCYAMVVKLGPGAHFSDDAHRSRDVAFGLQTADEDGSAGPGVVGPGGVGVFACRQRNEKGRFKLGLRDEVVGSGPVTVQILSRTASEAQLRREAAEDRAERIATERSMQQRQSETCRACIEKKIDCSRSGRSGCYEDFLSCVRIAGYRESTCGG